MKRMVCYCDMCGAEYDPRTSTDIGDWAIDATDMSGDMLFGPFDVCPNCQPIFIKCINRLFKHRKPFGTVS